MTTTSGDWFTSHYDPNTFKLQHFERGHVILFGIFTQYWFSFWAFCCFSPLVNCLKGPHSVFSTTWRALHRTCIKSHIHDSAKTEANGSDSNNDKSVTARIKRQSGINAQLNWIKYSLGWFFSQTSPSIDNSSITQATIKGNVMML